MRILMATSELFPFSKTGGLADMVAGLSGALAEAGHEVRVITPLYRGIREKFPALELLDWQCELPMADAWVRAQVWSSSTAKGVQIYFVDQPDYFGRAQLYQENGLGYADNPERFIFFSKCVTHLARYLPWRADILHLHDWQAAMVPLLIRDQTARDHWANPPRTCLTIHNLAYQGTCPADQFRLANLPQNQFNLGGAEFYGLFNPLKAGLAYADWLTTVSPSYSQEILSSEMGVGLHGVLQDRRQALTGILNGVDYTEWNTQNNPHLRHSYSAVNLEGKAANKLLLQQELGLLQAADVPLFASITRLAEQKGLHIMHDALQAHLSARFQFVLLGSGDPGIEALFLQMARHHPGRAAVRIGYDNALSHRIEAGADFFLMPSRYEPCGLNQLYSLRYGTIPIVRATGGLKDSVVDIDPKSNGTGITFDKYAPDALSAAIDRSCKLYGNKTALRDTMSRGMAADFSWQASAAKYAELFEKLSSQGPPS